MDKNKITELVAEDDLEVLMPKAVAGVVKNPQEVLMPKAVAGVVKNPQEVLKWAY